MDPKEKLSHVTLKPGVYLFKDEKGYIIYVGKAKKLRNRLRSHFNANPAVNRKHALMMAKVVDFETIVVDSEVEALILEANLIKEHKPKYNVNLKDDKSFPYIRVTNEEYSRIFVTRKMIRDGSQYFGPYTDVYGVRQLMKAIRRIFPVRSCQLPLSEQKIAEGKFKICLNYHIQRCLGPCENKISQIEYMELVNQIIVFIKGQSKALIEDLEERMKKAAQLQNFEEATRFRDQINSIQTFQTRQKVVDTQQSDKDVFSIVREDEMASAVVFIVRDGKIVRRQNFLLQEKLNESTENIFSDFFKQYYIRTDEIPPEIFVPFQIEEKENLQAWLSDKINKKVNIHVPQRGHNARLMKLGQSNAKLLMSEYLKQKEERANEIHPAVEALQRDLNLDNPPIHIEAFDISHLGGTDTVASMVMFKNGKPFKSGYRKYKIKTVQGIDDFKSMEEVVERRIVRLLNEDESLPDLILIDGGKGQLAAATDVLDKLGVENQSIIGLAKRLEEIFYPNLSDAQTLPKHSISLRLLQQVRDEAHRFAITFQKSLRKKHHVGSMLDSIPGIGEKKRNALLQAFGSIKKMKQVDVDTIANIQGMNSKTAQSVYDFIHHSDSEEDE